MLDVFLLCNVLLMKIQIYFHDYFFFQFYHEERLTVMEITFLSFPWTRIADPFYEYCCASPGEETLAERFFYISENENIGGNEKSEPSTFNGSFKKEMTDPTVCMKGSDRKKTEPRNYYAVYCARPT